MRMAKPKDKRSVRSGSFLAVLLGLSSVFVLPTAGTGQQAIVDSAAVSPIETESGFLQNQGAQPRFQSAGKISGDVLTATLQQRIASVPHFSGSFPFEGRTIPFTIVGSRPQDGGATQIPVQIIAVSLLFEGYVNEQGEPMVLDAEQVVRRVDASPVFRNASYPSVGQVQFVDAVQRAQFFRVMAADWHTVLMPPEVLKPVTIVVPRGMARVYHNRGLGVTFAVVDTSFFISQLNTIVQLENLRPDSLALVLTNNIFLAAKSDPKQCCVLGFHTSFPSGVQENLPQVQTMVWASWIDQGLLGSGVADITPISHEISEWANNPFGTNLVPAWQPLGLTGACQNNLETADPVAALPNAAYPVTINGVTYHPQTQVLLPWFTRQNASDTVDGALSFPDQNLVTGPAQSCVMK